MKILFDTVQGSLRKVEYKSELPKLELFGNIEDFHKKQLCTKFDDWDYEDEYRIVKSKAAKHIIKYPKGMIREIFLGCCLPHENKMEIINFVQENDVDCCIYELSLDKRIFRLNKLRIY